MEPPKSPKSDSTDHSVASEKSEERPNIFEKFAPLETRHAEMTRAFSGIDPLGAQIQRLISPTEALIDDRSCVLMGSNNYLGLTFDQNAIEAAAAALKDSGTGTTGSRVANGSYASHYALEHQLAEFFGCKHAILFTTGYQANVGFISAIAGKGEILLIDSDSHASIYDGCKLGDATVYRFRHNDAADLERRLARLPKEPAKLVIVEGIYSMRGDRAPLREVLEAAKRHGAYVMVDEAHSFGVLGKTGRGLAEELGVSDQVDFIIGTFSKSAGCVGGFCVSNLDGLESLRFASRAYVFTASLPPSVVASAQVTIERIRTDSSLRQKLWDNTDYFYSGLQELGFELGPDKSPVIGVSMPDAASALAGWHTLLKNGVYVNLALPPATPGNTALLRCSLSAAHSKEQLVKVLDAFRAVRDGLKSE